MHRSEAYHILGLHADASSAEIRARYRELAKQFHPDRNPLGAKQFQRITAAYEMLRRGGAASHHHHHRHSHSKTQDTGHYAYDEQQPPPPPPPDFPVMYAVGMFGATAVLVILTGALIDWDSRRPRPYGFNNLTPEARMMRLEALYHNRSNALRMAERSYCEELSQTSRRTSSVHPAVQCPNASTPAEDVGSTKKANGPGCRQGNFQLCTCCHFKGPPSPDTVVAVMSPHKGPVPVIIAVHGPGQQPNCTQDAVTNLAEVVAPSAAVETPLREGMLESVILPDAPSQMAHTVV